MRSSRFLHWNFRLDESNWVYRVVDLDRRKNFVKVSSKSVYSVMIYLVFPGTNIMVPRYSFPLWMLHRLCTIPGPDVTPKNIFDRWKSLVPHHFQKYHGSHTDTDGGKRSTNFTQVWLFYKFQYAYCSHSNMLIPPQHLSVKCNTFVDITLQIDSLL